LKGQLKHWHAIVASSYPAEGEIDALLLGYRKIKMCKLNGRERRGGYKEMKELKENNIWWVMC
jgi:hypothetical protein